jgi:hypothetical protein
MAVQIHTCDQGSPEWLKARAGLPTASEFHTVMAKGRDGGASVTRKTYMLKLAGEIITGEPAESYTNVHMERGRTMEADAREYYAFVRDVDPELIGFITNGAKGCSPDALVDDNGLLEIKTKLPHLQIECLLRDDLPPEHKAQCQGALWVAEREWIDFVSYWPRMPVFIHRAHRDEAYIKTLAEAVDAFNDELAALVERVRGLMPKAEAA